MRCQSLIESRDNSSEKRIVVLPKRGRMWSLRASSYSRPFGGRGVLGGHARVQLETELQVRLLTIRPSGKLSTERLLSITQSWDISQAKELYLICRQIKQDGSITGCSKSYCAKLLDLSIPTVQFSIRANDQILGIQVNISCGEGWRPRAEKARRCSKQE